MKVKEFNEFIQFGFPKDCCLEGDHIWYEAYDNLTCEFTNKLLLDKEETIDQQALDNLWIERIEDNPLAIWSFEEAASNYFKLKTNPIFKVGDKVTLVSDVGFYPDYWNHRRYKAYITDCKITKINDYLISYSMPDEGEELVIKNKFSLEGYKIKAIKGRNWTKILGYELDYSEYLVHQTPEIEELSKKNDEAGLSAKELYILAYELFSESFHPTNKETLDKVIKELYPLLTPERQNIIKSRLK